LTDARTHAAPEQMGTRKELGLAAFVVIAPLVALGAALVLWISGVAPSALDVAMLSLGALLTLAGVEIGFHRYFAHRSFDAHPALVWLLGVFGSSAMLGPVIWWVATHRRHHAYTDRAGDPHSPHWPYAGLRGVWHAHAGWLFRPAHTAMSLSAGEMRDLWKSARTVGIQRSYLLSGAGGIALPCGIGLVCDGARGALTGLLWGGLVRLFLVSHVVWAVNSLGHLSGSAARLPRSGQAKNNAWLIVPALGGGLHANHHDAPRAYTTRHAGSQIDLGGALLWLLARVGLVWNLKRSGVQPDDDTAEETSR
jgi:stearoyl-CoA desaturase (delta-9 desaturase)